MMDYVIGLACVVVGALVTRSVYTMGFRAGVQAGANGAKVIEGARQLLADIEATMDRMEIEFDPDDEDDGDCDERGLH